MRQKKDIIIPFPKSTEHSVTLLPSDPQIIKYRNGENIASNDKFSIRLNVFKT